MYCMYCSPAIVLLLAGRITCSVTESEFAVDGSLANKVCPDARKVFEQKAVSAISCVTMASKSSSCAGVSYNKEHRMCYGCDTSKDDSGQFLSLSGTVFYSRKIAYPEGFEDVSGHMLLVVTDQTSTDDQARSACAVYSASLVRIDSLDKFAAILAHLAPLRGGNLSFRIQCRKDVTDGVWKFDDGTPVPMSNDFWYPGQPYPNNGNCGYLHYWFGWKWDDLPCSNQFGYICEIQ